ncbi:MAG: hypothetical protein COB73_00665 [Flavobacteriaceae bacterium]|nr:MAG: hypothetical protein COB73_00665 [Flavobacteriaceae bacterium]
MSRILFIAIIFITIISCTPDEDKKMDEVKTTTLQEKAKVSSIGITLSPTAKKEVASWEKYQLIETKMQRYQSVTKSEALQNARDLSLLIEDVLDTIDVKILDRPDVKMRFNVLYNHAFRLHDMLSITSISEEEVMTEVTRLLDAYSAVNDKINVVYKIEEYKKSFGITELDTMMFADKSGMISGDEAPLQEELMRSDKSTKKAKQKPKRIPLKLKPANKGFIKKRKSPPLKKSDSFKKN